MNEWQFVTQSLKSNTLFHLECNATFSSSIFLADLKSYPVQRGLSCTDPRFVADTATLLKWRLNSWLKLRGWRKVWRQVKSNINKVSDHFQIKVVLLKLYILYVNCISWNALWLMTPTVHLKTKTKTNTECLKDQTYAIFSKSREFNDIKYDILAGQMVNFLLVNQTRPYHDIKVVALF